MKPSSKHLAFSLIEILVVTAIIASMLGVILTVLRKAREGAKKIECTSNLRQINLAIQLYSDNHDGQLILAEKMSPFHKLEEALCIWHNALLPYVAEIMHRKPQDLLKNTTDIWFCPADKDPYPKGFRNYPHEEVITSYAPNGYFPPAKNAPADVPENLKLGPAGGYHLTEISEPQLCMLMGETSYAPQFYDADAQSVQAYNLPHDGHHRCTSGFYHNESMNILYVDGHVDNIKGAKVDTLVWPEGFENQYRSGQYMYWADLTLPNATEEPAFWGPGY